MTSTYWKTQMSRIDAEAETRQGTSQEIRLKAGYGHFLVGKLFRRRTFARQRELEDRTVASLGLDPDLSATVLDDLLADGQTDSVARIFGPGVQTLEDDKNMFCVLRVNADAVIAHAEQPLRARLLRAHGNFRRIFPVELDRIPDQILE